LVGVEDTRAEDAFVSDVTVIDTDDRRIVRRAVVNASAADIFALVAGSHRIPQSTGREPAAGLMRLGYRCWSDQTERRRLRVAHQS